MSEGLLASVIVIAEALETKYVKEAIDNVLEQTYKNIEMIIISRILN